MDYDQDRGDTIATDETDRLIASNKVEGTSVYASDGEKLGSVHNFMVDKRSGKVEYAVLSSGGLFGMGGDYRPLPWNTLTYDTDKGGYVTNVARDQLEGAPSYGKTDEPRYDRDYDRRITDYYGVPAAY